MPRLQLEGITRHYPGVKANDGIDLTVAAGEIHAVLGENGAGKSTLMKIIHGSVRPDAGTVRWNGEAVQLASPAMAQALGISMVYQHFSLFETLSVAENVWLGLPRGESLASVARRIEAMGASYDLAVDPRRPLHALSVGERQRVEIIRALLGAPKLLILDEPTSVLAPQAIEGLFATLRRLASEGCSILYVSHKLDEIRALCDRCTVLRGGRVTGEVVPARETPGSLSRLMIGTEPPPLTRIAVQPGPVALSVHALSLPDETAHGTALDRVSLTLRTGEILGIAGVSGNGQQALLAALSGERVIGPGDDRGAVRLFGNPVGGLGPRERRALGLHFVPEERLGRGAVPALGLDRNTLLTRTEGIGRVGQLKPRAMQALAARLIERFDVRAGGPGSAASSLSGGNLQKFIVGREIDAEPKVLVVAQPTWGVDVGAAAVIRAELLALRGRGAAVLVVSEDLDELFLLCDRLQVIARGRLSPALPLAETSPAQVGEWMSGLWPGAGTEGAAVAAADGTR
jgi:simple sugar transport system ATP-binding protein